MWFVLNGMRQNLEAADVIKAASQTVPDEFDGRHKYYVDVGGCRFPPKQLFAQATGRNRDEFITHEAIRHLRKLGFVVEEFAGSLFPEPESNTAAEPGEIETGTQAVFAVSLEADEEGYIVASCPQFPGCHSQGRSKQEAVRNIEEAIRGYIASMRHHGEEIPAVDWELVKVAP